MVDVGGKRYISSLHVGSPNGKMGYFHNSTIGTFLVPMKMRGHVQQIGFYVDRMGIRGIYLIGDGGKTVDDIGVVGTAHFLSQVILPARGGLVGDFDVGEPRITELATMMLTDALILSGAEAYSSWSPATWLTIPSAITFSTTIAAEGR